MKGISTIHNIHVWSKFCEQYRIYIEEEEGEKEMNNMKKKKKKKKKEE